MCVCIILPLISSRWTTSPLRIFRNPNRNGLQQTSLLNPELLDSTLPFLPTGLHWLQSLQSPSVTSFSTSTDLLLKVILDQHRHDYKKASLSACLLFDWKWNVFHWIWSWETFWFDNLHYGNSMQPAAHCIHKFGIIFTTVIKLTVISYYGF